MKKFLKTTLFILTIVMVVFAIWFSRNWIEAGRQIKLSDSSTFLNGLEPYGSVSENQKLIFLMHDWEPNSNWPCSVLFGKWHVSSYLVRDITSSRNHFDRALISCRLERDYTDYQLGNYFLTKAYVGNGEYGVEKVSQQFFEKPFNDLTKGNVIQVGLIIKMPSLRNDRKRLRVKTDYWLEKLKIQ